MRYVRTTTATTTHQMTHEQAAHKSAVVVVNHYRGGWLHHYGRWRCDYLRGLLHRYGLRVALLHHYRLLRHYLRRVVTASAQQDQEED
ncbi:TPA: hypothetical protein NPN74_001592 [Klebsiella quasipneumoniae subsp. quasipneumoniae]|nr:hypothetical protein [Klebsiella quasipneumoniae subsp. quasipneumoniae]